MIGSWQRRLRKLFGIAKIANGHAHRFRDTFATELLLAGVPMDRVAVLLGHQSVSVTEKFYAAWTAERQRQAEADLERAWEAIRSSVRTGRVRRSYAGKRSTLTNGKQRREIGGAGGNRTQVGILEASIIQ